MGAASGFFIGKHAFFNNKPDDRIPRFGQNDQGNPGERLRNWMIEQLDLDEQQEEAFFKTLHESRLSGRQIVRESQDELEENLEKEHQHLMSRLEEILSPEQLQEFENRFSRKAMMERRRRHEHRERRGPGR